MSFGLVDKVLRVDGREAPLTAPVKMVLTGLVRYANDDGTQARPSVDTLSRSTSLTERTVQRALRELERMSLIVEVTPATRYTPTVYSINVRALDALPKIKQGRQTVTPEGRKKPVGVTLTTGRGDSQSARGDRVSPDSILHSVKDSTSTRTPSSFRREASTSSLEAAEQKQTDAETRAGLALKVFEAYGQGYRALYHKGPAPIERKDMLHLCRVLNRYDLPMVLDLVVCFFGATGKLTGEFFAEHGHALNIFYSSIPTLVAIRAGKLK
jgi:Helix-turn-helix domain